MKNYKIAVAGTGYVGLSLGVLLSQHHQVVAVDIVQAKVDMINNKKSPIQDDYIEKYLAEKELNLTATLDAKAAYSDADFVVIAAPTNYDSKTQHFDTSAVEAVIKLVMEYELEKVLILGTADFSMPYLCQMKGIKKIKICDICKTPLNICQNVAKANNFSWEVEQKNVFDGLNEKYDIVINDAFITRFEYDKKRIVFCIE